MPTTTPTLTDYLTYWLREVVEPNLAPKTTEKYALLTRLYLVPSLGAKRLDRLQVRDVRTGSTGYVSPASAAPRVKM